MKYSIAIPAYKPEYLKECIESILNQTYQDFELIIVNDASPFNIDNVMAQFNDSRIRYYINTKNCGAVDVVDNWNICLSYAKGDYIICMGDDDKLAPDCLEVYNALIEKYSGLGVYHTRTEIIDENSKHIRFTEKRAEFENVYENIWYSMQNRIQFIGDFLFDVKLLKRNGGFYKLPLAWGSDYVSVYIATNYKGLAHSNYPAFLYRINRYTISNTGNLDVKFHAFDLKVSWIKEFINNVEPNDENDKKTVSLIKENLDSYRTRKQIMMLSNELSGTGKSIMSFIPIVRQHKMTWLGILKCYMKIVLKI